MIGRKGGVTSFNQLNPKQIKNVHSVAVFVKTWLSLQPESLLTKKLSPKVEDCEQIKDDKLRRSFVISLLYTLPKQNRVMLDSLLSMAHAIKELHTNTEYKTALCKTFAKLLIDRCVHNSSDTQEVGVQTIRYMMDNYGAIFRSLSFPSIRFEATETATRWQVKAASLDELKVKLIDPLYASEESTIGNFWLVSFFFSV